MTCFSEKNFHFYTRFLVIDQVFLILCIFNVSTVVYDPFFTRKSTISEKNSLTPIFFTLFELSRPSHNTNSQNIGGGQCMGRPPPQILGGTVPPRSPLVSLSISCA